MTTLVILDYAAEILELLYIFTTALLRLTVRVAVLCYVAGKAAGDYYHSTAPIYTFDFSRVDANLQSYLGGRRLQSHPAMIR